MKIRSILLAALVAVTPLCAAMKILRTMHVPGEGGWDYLTVDSGAKRLYISRGTHVAVMDLVTGKAAGDIPNTAGVHGIVLANKLGKGFISAGRANTVIVFDPKDLSTKNSIPTGKNPDFILFDEPSGKVITFNGGSADATVIDASAGTVSSTVALGGKPEGAVSDGKGHVYVNIEDTAELVELDPRAGKVMKRIKMEGCEGPSGLAIDVKKGRTFSGCDNKVMAVTDLAAGKVIVKIPIGGGVDANAFDQERGLAFSSNGESGTLTVAKEVNGKYEVVQTVKTQSGARTMAFDPASHHVFLITAKYGPTPANAKGPYPHGPMVKSSFVVLEVGE